MFQNVDDLEICQIFSKLSNYFCHTNISNYLPNISDLYTSTRVCCDSRVETTKVKGRVFWALPFSFVQILNIKWKVSC